MSGQLLSFFLSDSQLRLDDEEATAQDQPKLLWKVVLRTGTWKLRPGPGGIKLKEPLKIFRDKATKGHISMSSLVKNFDAGAKEHVTLPVVHADGTTSDSGFVRKLVIQDVAGEDGSQAKQSLLWAGIEVTDSAIKTKIEEKSLVGVSGGILFDYERTEDGKKFDQILSHVMVTNTPWINGTGGFQNNLPEGVMASESEDLPIGEMDFESTDLDIGDPTEKPDPTKKNPPSPGEVIWKPDDGFAWIKGRLQRALENQRRALMSQFGENFYKLDYPYYSIDDVQGNGTGGKAMICSGYGSERDSWVATYNFGSEGVEIEAFQNWVPARPEWVVASEPTPAPAKVLPSRTAKSYLADETPLQKAQRLRAERLGLSKSPTTEGGPRMGRIADLLASKGLELSDEERALIRAEEEETERLRQRDAESRKETKKSDTKSFLASLKDTPFDNPGTLRVVEGIFMSDDGEPAINLSELTDTGHRTEPRHQTATEIVKLLFDSLPKDADGKLTLSGQAPRLPDDKRPQKDPPEDPENPDDDDLTPQQKSDAQFAEFHSQGLDLGIPVPAGKEA